MVREEIIEMKEEVKWIINRTRIYLVPQLIYKIQVPLGNPKGWFLGNEHYPLDFPHLVGVYDIRSVENYSSKIKKLKESELYITDYALDGSSIDDFYHCVVFKIEEEYSFRQFLKGNYSKMYTEPEKEQYFGNIPKTPVSKYMETAKEVVFKVPARRIVFEEEVNRLKSGIDDPRTRIRIPKNHEYDFKPSLLKECITFNNNEITHPTLLKLFNND